MYSRANLKVFRSQGLGKFSRELNASEEIWKFFEGVSKAEK